MSRSTARIRAIRHTAWSGPRDPTNSGSHFPTSSFGRQSVSRVPAICGSPRRTSNTPRTGSGMQSSRSSFGTDWCGGRRSTTVDHSSRLLGLMPTVSWHPPDSRRSWRLSSMTPRQSASIQRPTRCISTWLRRIRVVRHEVCSTKPRSWIAPNPGVESPASRKSRRPTRHSATSCQAGFDGCSRVDTCCSPSRSWIASPRSGSSSPSPSLTREGWRA